MKSSLRAAILVTVASFVGAAALSAAVNGGVAVAASAASGLNLDQVALRLQSQDRRLDKHAQALETLRAAVVGMRGGGAVPPAERPAADPPRGEPLLGYIMRSAKTGNAWIVPASGTWDAKPVLIRPGDKVKGLGRVVAVRQARGGQWVVETDRGHLRMPDMPT